MAPVPGLPHVGNASCRHDESHVSRDYKAAAHRVQESLIQRKLYHTLSLSARRKIQAIPSDLSEPHLGLDGTTYARVASGLASVIHCAWSVNFNKSLMSFEKDGLREYITALLPEILLLIWMHI